MKMNKKLIGIALAAALLAFPLSSVIAQAGIPTTPVAIASTVTATEAVTPVPTAEVVTPVVAPEVVAPAPAPAPAIEVVTPVVVPEVVTPIPTPEVVPPVVATVTDADGKLVIPSTQYSDFIDKLQLALAFDPARKGELNKRHALRKLAQAQQYMKDGNVEACKIAFNEYKDKIAKAQAFLTAAEDPDSAIAKALTIALADVDAKNIQVLTALIDKVPAQAAQKLALNVVRTMQKAVAKIQKEEAKVDPAVTPVVPTDTEKKDLEKQTKAALTDFKTAVNGKDNEDKYITDPKAKDNQRTEKIQSEVNQKLKNLSHPTVRTSENKDGQNQQGDYDSNKGGDNNRRDHK